VQKPNTKHCGTAEDSLEFDEAGYDWIGFFKPPDRPEWAGILDRLQRASHR
jgi:hypothetical protein